MNPTTHLPLNTLQWTQLCHQYGCLQSLPRKQYVGQNGLQRSTGSLLITTLCHTCSLDQAKCSNSALASIPVRGAYGILSYCRTVRKRVCTELTYLNFREYWCTYVCARICVCVCVCVCVVSTLCVWGGVITLKWVTKKYTAYITHTYIASNNGMRPVSYNYTSDKGVLCKAVMHTEQCSPFVWCPYW